MCFYIYIYMCVCVFNSELYKLKDAQATAENPKQQAPVR